MENLSEIKSALRDGDQKLISDATGYCRDYVGMVLDGKRRNEGIVQAAKEIIKNRYYLMRDLNQYHKSNQFEKL